MRGSPSRARQDDRAVALVQVGLDDFKLVNARWDMPPATRSFDRSAIACASAFVKPTWLPARVATSSAS